jgi:hypothetical protein
VAINRQGWMADLSSQFKRHRQGRSGWFLRIKRDRLRLLSDELPPRTGEAIRGPDQSEHTLARLRSWLCLAVVGKKWGCPGD